MSNLDRGERLMMRWIRLESSMMSSRITMRTKPRREPRVAPIIAPLLISLPSVSGTSPFVGARKVASAVGSARRASFVVVLREGVVVGSDNELSELGEVVRVEARDIDVDNVVCLVKGCVKDGDEENENGTPVFWDKVAVNGRCRCSLLGPSKGGPFPKRPLKFKSVGNDLEEMYIIKNTKTNEQHRSPAVDVKNVKQERPWPSTSNKMYLQ